MKILPALTVALALAVAYLIGAGDQPTTAVGTVAPATVASTPTVAPAVPVVQVAAVAPSAEEATALAALLAAEDELAETSATVVARATERAGQKTATPAKVAPVKAPAKTAGATAPAKAGQKAGKAAAKADAKTSRAPSNEELAYRIDQIAEDTCERRAGGIVAEDYTCVGADFYGKPATPKVKAQGKATNADTVPLGEGKTRCPSGYSRDKTDRSLCVGKS